MKHPKLTLGVLTFHEVERVNKGENGAYPVKTDTHYI